MFAGFVQESEKMINQEMLLSRNVGKMLLFRVERNQEDSVCIFYIQNKIIYHGQVRVIPSFNIHKSINATYHINNWDEKIT